MDDILSSSLKFFVINTDYKYVRYEDRFGFSYLLPKSGSRPYDGFFLLLKQQISDII